MATTFVAGYTASSRTTMRRSSNVSGNISESGFLRFIDLGAQNYWEIMPYFENLTEAERDTLEDWLVANETAEIDLTIDTTVYRGYINPGSNISVKPSNRTGHLWDLSFGFVGVKQ